MKNHFMHDRLLEMTLKELIDGTPILIWSKMDKARSFPVVLTRYQ